MADDAASIDTQALAETLATAMGARQDQFTLYNEAVAAGDAAGLAAHDAAYQKALAVEQKAEAALEGSVLNTPANVQALADLANANTQLAAADAALKADIAALTQFTEAADAALTILGTIALA